MILYQCDGKIHKSLQQTDLQDCLNVQKKKAHRKETNTKKGGFNYHEGYYRRLASEKKHHTT